MLEHLYNKVLFAGITISANDIGAPQVAANSGSLTNILNVVYFWAGVVCIIVVIIGGFRYVTSSGDAGGVKAGKDTILYGIVGLVVIIMAATVTGLIVGRF